MHSTKFNKKSIISLKHEFLLKLNCTIFHFPHFSTLPDGHSSPCYSICSPGRENVKLIDILNMAAGDQKLSKNIEFSTFFDIFWSTLGKTRKYTKITENNNIQYPNTSISLLPYHYSISLV